MVTISSPLWDEASGTCAHHPKTESLPCRECLLENDPQFEVRGLTEGDLLWIDYQEASVIGIFHEKGNHTLCPHNRSRFEGPFAWFGEMEEREQKIISLHLDVRAVLHGCRAATGT